MPKSRRKSAPAQTVGQVTDLIEKRTPVAGAEKWDNVGLLVGDPKKKVTGAVISIDLTAASIAEAERLGYSLIVNHHPCIFKGLSRVTRSGSSSLVFEAARRGISVVSSHTNFDRFALEAPLAAASALGVQVIGRLHDEDEPPFIKLVVFVPVSHAERVRDAVCAVGAGQIGKYDSCSFSSQGEGTFRGGEGTKPFLGKKGRLETAKEVRLETIFPRALKKSVLRALKESHPYEEIAYDLYRVEQGASSVGVVSGLGYGFYGDFKTALSFAEFSKHVKTVFDVDGFWASEPAPKKIKRIGFVAGKGASFVSAAERARCDLFLTGEAGYHVVREAAERGMAIVEIGHTESELFFLKTVASWMKEWKIPSKSLRTKQQKITAVQRSRSI